MESELTDRQLQDALLRTAGDARVLAVLFILTGGLGCWLGIMFIRQTDGQVFGAGCATMLLAPGIMYWLAGRQIRAHQSAGGRLGMWAGVSHLAAIPLTFLVVAVIHGPVFRTLVMPAGVSIFFTPALIAFLFSMRRAQRIARLMDAPGQGFAVLPLKVVIPLEDEQRDGSSPG